MKKKILILNGQYLPGFKGGGPIQSCVNMIENLYDKYDFYVLCSDRDFKSETPYREIKINDWNLVGHANVFYMSPDLQTFKGVSQTINSIDYDILYLNGFFSPIFTIKPLVLKKFGKLSKKAMFILTPRGDFTGGCENKKLKKYAYIYFSKMIGLYKGLKWHATSDIEKRDIFEKFSKADVTIIPNLPAKYIEHEKQLEKVPGKLRVVFISRIFPKKNLKCALEVLKKIKKGNVIFDIYGPMEDSNYWNECKKVIELMPSNVAVSYCGEIEHDKIPAVFESYHCFFFPTLGENYGHVIVEAMMNNCLTILSEETTPWDDYISKLDIGAKLGDLIKFEKIVNKLIDLNQNEYNELLKQNSEYLQKKFDASATIKDYVNFFDKK